MLDLPPDVSRTLARAALAAEGDSLAAWLRLSMVSRTWRKALAGIHRPDLSALMIDSGKRWACYPHKLDVHTKVRDYDNASCMLTQYESNESNGDLSLSCVTYRATSTSCGQALSSNRHRGKVTWVR